MKIRIYEIKTGETIFTGSVKRKDSLESVLQRIGKVNFTDIQKSFKTKSGKVYNYFNIVFEII